jgi:hypothetical protein
MRLAPQVLLILALALGVGLPAVAQEADATAGVRDMLQRLKREARLVWTDARPVVAEVTFAQRDEGLQATAAMVFVTSAGIVDGTLVTLGDELPTVHLERRKEGTPQVERVRWERRFSVIRKFEWHHCNGEWVDVCDLPRPEKLRVGETLQLSLDAHGRIPVVLMRHSAGDAACRVDSRGTIYPFFPEAEDAGEGETP